jgi:hypothetical protein
MDAAPLRPRGPDLFRLTEIGAFFGGRASCSAMVTFPLCRQPDAKFGVGDGRAVSSGRALPLAFLPSHGVRYA